MYLQTRHYKEILEIRVGHPSAKIVRERYKITDHYWKVLLEGATLYCPVHTWRWEL